MNSSLRNFQFALVFASCFLFQTALADKARFAEDTAITMQLSSALREDPGLSGLRISVATMRGIVQLRGVVEFPAQKARAEEIARKTAGVKDVKNQITVYKVAKK